MISADHAWEGVMAKRKTVKTVHRLKVTLRQVEPPVWRRIEVASEMTLSTLAGVLEGAMGWHGGHLHAFDIDGVSYALPDGEGFGFRRTADERRAKLGGVLPAATPAMRWDYDFGDGWEHDVVVEAIEPRQAGSTPPVCIGGGRACPPEDCGGPWGYEELLAALADPTHERHEEFSEWLPEGFDPEAFDIAGATEMMRRVGLHPEW